MSHLQKKRAAVGIFTHAVTLTTRGVGLIIAAGQYLIALFGNDVNHRMRAGLIRKLALHCFFCILIW